MQPPATRFDRLQAEQDEAGQKQREERLVSNRGGCVDEEGIDHGECGGDARNPLLEDSPADEVQQHDRQRVRHGLRELDRELGVTEELEPDRDEDRVERSRPHRIARICEAVAAHEALRAFEKYELGVRPEYGVNGGDRSKSEQERSKEERRCKPCRTASSLMAG